MLYDDAIFSGYRVYEMTLRKNMWETWHSAQSIESDNNIYPSSIPAFPLVLLWMFQKRYLKITSSGCFGGLLGKHTRFGDSGELSGGGPSWVGWSWSTGLRRNSHPGFATNSVITWPLACHWHLLHNWSMASSCYKILWDMSSLP
jgi:hypothetical protein